MEDCILIKGKKTIEYINNDSKRPLELLCLQFDESLIELLSTPTCQLNYCYKQSINPVEVFQCNFEKIMLIKNLGFKLMALENDHAFGVNLFKESTLTMLLVLVNRAYEEKILLNQKTTGKTFLIDSIFLYIANHIYEEITLQQLESTFYVSRFHISREFKKHSGTTLHKFVIKRKLELAKELIKNGNTATEANNKCNIGTLNNFYRVFKREYGMTPKSYQLQTKSEIGRIDGP